MTDFLIKDIDELLRLQKGDSSRLNKIKDEFEKTKIISIQDRKYVEYLTSRYFKEEETKPKPKRSYEKSLQELGYKRPTEANVPPPKEKIEQIFTTKPTEKKSILKSKIEEKRKTHQSSAFESYKGTIPSINLNAKKIGLIAGPIIAVIILAAAATQLDLDGFSSPTPTPTTPQPTPTTPVSDIVLNLDSNLYNKGDIISISGQSVRSMGDKIILSIQNPNNVLVWSEEVKVRDSGNFSTLLIAAGSGWNISGSYILKAEHGSLEKQTMFDYRG